MPRRKLTILQELRAAIDKANAEGKDVLAAELSQIRHAVRGKTSPLALVPLLDTATSQITKSFVSIVLGAAKDVRVLKPLMRAAVNPANTNYAAWYLWACARYDCSAYLSFFVRFLLTCPEANEAMLSASEVIKAMKGPFAPAAVKGAIARLLRPKLRLEELESQAEFFRVQAAYALLDTYYDQVDHEWKNEP
ncbi:hypothetical protein AUC43_12930 [Hymenobacter sedentarius]|uniref:Uncharacterized protein n=1 Tax=Hymenobacter sedentarius TaxID=1411621 RepID=A0A0U4AR37_9BACT|nr:hypothetical protein [Hymenobacter sedentarius]ALW85920.1 hypothetical protein AUC43_12930 [Hymenobacter sedentarius]